MLIVVPQNFSSVVIDPELLQPSLLLHHTQTQAQRCPLLGEDSPILEGTPLAVVELIRNFEND